MTAHTSDMRMEATHSLEGIIARVLHVARARVVDLDLLALSCGRGNKERVDARRRRRIILGRRWWWSVAVGWYGRWRGSAFARARGHAVQTVWIFVGGGLGKKASANRAQMRYTGYQVAARRVSRSSEDRLRQITRAGGARGREERGRRRGGQREDTTTVHAPIRKDALLQAGNVAGRLPFGSLLWASPGTLVRLVVTTPLVQLELN